MSEVKIITHTTYTYETSDGREFDYAQEAEAWEKALSNIKNVAMLDAKFRPTTEVSSAFFVHIKTHDQLDAFSEIQAYEGMCAEIREVGYHYYDECTDTYLNIGKELKRLHDIIDKLDSWQKLEEVC